MGKVKKQHFVPRFYLNYFTNEDSKISALDIQTQEIFQTSVENVAHKKFFYDHEQLDGIAGEQAIEKALSVRETEAAESYKRTVEHLQKNITGGLHINDRILLAEHVTIQMFRTPEHRVISEEMVNELKRQLQEKGINDEFQDWLESFNPKDQQLYGLFGTDNKDKIWELFDRYWIFWDNQTQYKFYTSDHPVIGHTHQNIGPSAYEIYFPLTPRFALSILIKEQFPEWKDQDNSIVILKDPENVKFYNDLILRKCNRQIYSIDKDFELAINILKSHPEITDPNRPRTG